MMQPIAVCLALGLQEVYGMGDGVVRVQQQKSPGLFLGVFWAFKCYAYLRLSMYWSISSL